MSIRLFTTGDLVWVRIGTGKSAKTLAGRVLASNSEHMYQVELEEELKDLSGQKRMHKWIAKDPIAHTQLKRRVQ